MANLRGVGGMKQLDLIATYKPSQLTKSKDDPNKTNGVFLTVQVDQSTMSKADAEAGKADSNPYIESHKEKGDKGEYTSHNVWYSSNQLAAMEAAGNMVTQKDGSVSIAFKADVQKVKDGKTDTSRLIVLTPKDVSKAKNDEEKAKIEKYNEAHPMGASSNTKFNTKSLEKQAAITAIAKDVRAKERENMVEPEVAVEAEAAVEAEM